MSWRAVVSLAKRLGIEVIDAEPVGPFGPYRCAGPAGGACDIRTRQVWTDGPDARLRPFELLHEVMHVYLALPRRALARQPCEGRLLLQVERAFALRMLDGDEYDACVAWQRETTIQGVRNRGRWVYDLDTAPSGYWERGVEIAERIGVLDCYGRPTCAPPAWQRLSAADRRYLTASA